MSKGQGENFTLSAMTDLMTSLAVIFILLLVIYLNHSYQETQKGSENRKLDLLKKLANVGIKAENDHKDPLALIIRVHDDTLQFDPDGAIIKSKGHVFLSSFIPKLTEIICSPETYNDVESILIQGFTDSDYTDEHNLELSQNRALIVLKYSLNNTKLNFRKRSCLLNLSSTNGRGEMDLLPFGSKPGKENKKQSRRVEFKIRVKSFEQKKKINNDLTELNNQNTGY